MSAGNIITAMTQNILFVCSQNWHRSKTAETLFATSKQINVKSAGTHASAETPLSVDLLMWADKILVMQPHHKESILNKFKTTIDDDQIIILHIPDNYQYMDPELQKILKEKISHFISSQK